jgi:hypothetical protein
MYVMAINGKATPFWSGFVGTDIVPMQSERVRTYDPPAREARDALNQLSYAPAISRAIRLLDFQDLICRSKAAASVFSENSFVKTIRQSLAFALKPL